MSFQTWTGPMKEAHVHRDYEIPFEDEVLDTGVTEANIASTDPRVEFEDDQGQEAGENANIAEDPNGLVLTNDGPEGE